MRERFLLDAEELNETRFAKLSPVDVAGFAGELDRLDVVDKGVDLPEAPFVGDTMGNIRLELIGGGLLGAFELVDQLKPFRSSIAGNVAASVEVARGSGWNWVQS